MSSGPRPHNFLAFIGVIAIVAGALGTRHQSVSAAPVPTGRHDFGALAPAFVANAGEADRTARFVSVGGGRPVFFTHGRRTDGRCQASAIAVADVRERRRSADRRRVSHRRPRHVSSRSEEPRQPCRRERLTSRISRRRVPSPLAGDRRAHHRSQQRPEVFLRDRAAQRSAGDSSSLRGRRSHGAHERRRTDDRRRRQHDGRWRADRLSARRRAHRYRSTSASP